MKRCALSIVVFTAVTGMIAAAVRLEYRDGKSKDCELIGFKEAAPAFFASLKDAGLDRAAFLRALPALTEMPGLAQKVYKRLHETQQKQVSVKFIQTTLTYIHGVLTADTTSGGAIAWGKVVDDVQLGMELEGREFTKTNVLVFTCHARNVSKTEEMTIRGFQQQACGLSLTPAAGGEPIYPNDKTDAEKSFILGATKLKAGESSSIRIELKYGEWEFRQPGLGYIDWPPPGKYTVAAQLTADERKLVSGSIEITITDKRDAVPSQPTVTNQASSARCGGWGDEANGLRCAITKYEPVAFYDKAYTVEVTITNVTDKSIVIPRPPRGGNMVSTRGGTTLYRPMVQCPKLPPIEAIGAALAFPPVTNNFVTISAGASFHFESQSHYALTETHDNLKCNHPASAFWDLPPGNCSLRFDYHDYLAQRCPDEVVKQLTANGEVLWTGNGSSAPVTIELRHDAEQPARAVATRLLGRVERIEALESARLRRYMPGHCFFFAVAPHPAPGVLACPSPSAVVAVRIGNSNVATNKATVICTVGMAAETEDRGVAQLIAEAGISVKDADTAKDIALMYAELNLSTVRTKPFSEDGSRVVQHTPPESKDWAFDVSEKDGAWHVTYVLEVERGLHISYQYRLTVTPDGKVTTERLKKVEQVYGGYR